MNNVEAMFLEQMAKEDFQKTIGDNFDFVDSLIDQRDLNRIMDEEDI